MSFVLLASGFVFFSEEVCLKTEIQWEDDWLNYINDIYEFAIQMTETSLRELIVDPNYHLREAKECPVFLAVFEKYTGICYIFLLISNH